MLKQRMLKQRMLLLRRLSRTNKQLSVMDFSKVRYAKPASVMLITLGCSKNRVDSEHLLRQMESAGVTLLPDNYEVGTAFTTPCDAIIINTCGFIKDAKVESINTIFAAINAKNAGITKYVFVFGCLSQRYKDELVADIPEVDGFFGAFDISGVLNAMSIGRNASCEQERYLTTPKHYAYLKISEGCNRHCAYCSIPGIRGRHKSVPIEELVKEAENLAKNGVRELIVVAQDTTYYGLDLYRRRALADLLEQLCKVDGIEWIRVHYSYPAQFPKNVLRVMASQPKICKYLDIPLQHASTKVLALMKRSIDMEGTQRLIDEIRETVPGIVLRTTMIVGHPGEDKREFEKLLAFVKHNRFEMLGAFTYSEEEGTYGAKHYKDSVRESTKQKRYDELMELQATISNEIHLYRIGSVEKVIVDSFSDGILHCRSMYESPDVDGEIKVVPAGIENPADFVGNFITVKITGSDDYDWEGCIV